MEQYVQELLEYNPKYNAEFLEKAYLTAVECHKTQLRKSGEPYIIHPMAVGKILAELGMDEKTIAAGLLHDVVEDTSFTREDVAREFGDDVALLVDGVTKLTNLKFESKESAKAENVRKMFLAMSKDIRVLIIKLSDRLHNMRTIKYMKPEKIREKCTETLEIYAPLAARLGIYAFKFEFENIAFQNLEPEAYMALDAEMAKRNIMRKNLVDDIISDLNKVLSTLDIEYEVYGRNKHYYSIYKKMMYQKKQLDEIFDLTAVRIIVDSVRDCYGVLGAVHTMWTPIPGRFKDYIAMPKPNNYQSLHTTVIGKNGNPFEIQIRTREMHRIAEYGIAAHWKYKEGIASDDEEVKLAWLRQTLEWQKEVDDSSEFMETVKMDLFSNQVFVFTPKGDVMELPSGSTPLDFAFKIHTAVGIKCTGAKVNGKMVPIDYKLQNGEIVDIVTSGNSKGPSIDWLNIVKTAAAKNKIRQYLKKENKPANTEKGKDLLEKMIKRKGFENSQLLKNGYLIKAARAQGYLTIDELYNAVGYGGPIVNKTAQLLIDYYDEEEKAEQIRKEKEEKRKAEKAAAQAEKRKKVNTKGVTVKGVDNLLIKFARCCNPIPGDDIIGFTTKGHGVSIHRKDCVNMVKLPEQEIPRLIEVSWSGGENMDMNFEAGITIIAENHKGIFSSVSKLCDDMDIEILGLNTKTEHGKTIIMDILLAIKSTDDIVKVMSRMRQLKGVAEVFRTRA